MTAEESKGSRGRWDVCRLLLEIWLAAHPDSHKKGRLGKKELRRIEFNFDKLVFTLVSV